MSTKYCDLPSGSKLSESNWIDAVCDQYSHEMNAGNSPKLEDYIQRCPGNRRERLLEELLILEWDRNGPQDSPPVQLKEGSKIPNWWDLMNTIWQRFHKNILKEDATVVETKPEIISRYRIEKLVGKGTFGMVYQAFDEKLKRLVALKINHTSFHNSKELENALQEAQFLAKLDHPHIVPVYDVGQTKDNRLFLVSKMMERGSLKTMMRQHKLSVSESLEITFQIAEALCHTHERGIYHRDIKPANILLDSNGYFYLTDFGLAIHQDDQYLLRNQIAGTPSYMSPEQVKGNAQWLDGRSDLWSLGVLLYLLLTGRVPFSGRTQQDTFESILHQNPVPLRQRNPQLMPELETICQKLLQKNPIDRYFSATDLLNDLHIINNPQEKNEHLEEKKVHDNSKSMIYILVLLAVILLSSVLLIAQSHS